MKHLYPFKIKLLCLIVIAEISIIQSSAQPSVNALLETNQVSAMIQNRGDMFWDLAAFAKYEVPKGTGKTPLFASGLWLGGTTAGNNLHLAAVTYRTGTGSDYFTGPLDTINGTTDSITAINYNQIWTMTSSEVEAFRTDWNNGGTLSVSPAILNWPAQGSGNFTHNLAPFVDLDGNGVYNPATGGDYPLIRGDVMVYWIFNDYLAPHRQTGGTPLQVEVHASAYGFNCPTVNDSLKIMNFTTFYHYDIINRSNNTYSNFKMGVFMDPDLGNGKDDKIGCLPEQNFGFCYNGDDMDSTGQGNTYGAHPPILSTVILDGPLATPNDGQDNNNNGQTDEAGEKCLMTNFQYFNSFAGSDPITTDPISPVEYYYYLNSKWKDNTSVLDCNNNPTKFSYPGNPGENPPCVDTISTDVRMVLCSGGISFTPNQSIPLDYAIVYSRNATADYGTPEYFQQAIDDVDDVQNWYKAGYFSDCSSSTNAINELSNSSNQLRIFPNPTSYSSTLEFTSPYTQKGTITVRDIMGRTILNQTFQALKGNNRLPLNVGKSGIFFVSVGVGEWKGVGKVVVE